MGIHLARIYASAITIRAKNIYHLLYTVTVPNPNVLAADVFGTDNLVDI